MMLIEIAGLDLSTYNNIVRDLVSDSRDNQVEPALPIEIKKLKDLRDQARKAKDTAHVINDDMASILTQQIDITKIVELKERIDELVDIIDDLNVPNDESRLREKLRYSISLDKAILSLEDVKTTVDFMDAEQISPNTDDNNVQKMGSMFAGLRYNDNQSWTRSKNRFYANRRKFNKSRAHGRSRQRNYDQQRKGGSSYHRDERNRADDRTYDSDDDSQHESPTRSVHQRLGKRREHNDETQSAQKKDRFSNQDEIIEDAESNGGDPYFRNEGRPRSRRT